MILETTENENSTLENNLSRKILTGKLQHLFLYTYRPLHSLCRALALALALALSYLFYIGAALQSMYCTTEVPQKGESKNTQKRGS